MTSKTRLKKIEQARTAGNGTDRIIICYDDTLDKDIVKFDGVLMTRKEADTKAAALPDNVLIIRVIYASRDMAEVAE